ncbi:MAG TPA: hypothetical protein VFO14_01760 [Vicinamibacterales bacterium]|nr:hypothetical protein [Vicinamibacterales bacterium]
MSTPTFATHPLDSASGLASDGVVVPFEDGHSRQLPRLTRGPFRYATHASKYLAAPRALTSRPVKQAVISASALSLLYQPPGIDGYSRDPFLRPDSIVFVGIPSIRSWKPSIKYVTGSCSPHGTYPSRRSHDRRLRLRAVRGRRIDITGGRVSEDSCAGAGNCSCFAGSGPRS